MLAAGRNQRAPLISLEARVARILTLHIDVCVPSGLESCPRRYCPDLSEFDINELNDAMRLTAAQESFWFGRYNALKHNVLLRREELNASGVDLPLLEILERQWAEAEQIRNAILCVFSKLAVSVATRIAGTDHDFDEMISEANWTLVLAIEKFDADRGFRFSTYATHAIRRNLYRYIQNKYTQSMRAVGTDSPEAFPDDDVDRHDERQAASNYAKLTELVAQLDERERSIVIARFGLQRGTEPRTLRGIAGEYGISRERVRQLEQRALKKLNQMAADQEFEPFEWIQS